MSTSTAPLASDTAGFDLDAAVRAACERIAPLWPLDRFVAVNPLMGLTHMRFPRAVAEMRAVRGARALAPARMLRTMLADGRITDADLAEALTWLPGDADAPATAAALKEAIEALDDDPPHPTAATMADTIDAARDAGAAALAREQVAAWCAAYWDAGQATWRLPGRRERTPYAAWRATALLDRTPDVVGWRGAREAMAALPDDPMAAIRTVVDALDLPAEAVPVYLHAALASIGGWAAYVRYTGWPAALRGERDDSLVHLLAIRLAWDHGLRAALTRAERDVDPAWRARMDAMAGLADEAAPTRAETVALAGQLAREIAVQRRLAAAVPGAVKPGDTAARPGVQAAFCIDVRSEVFRRALEAADSGIETLGMAGFFGVPFRFRQLGHADATPHAPALIDPDHTVSETVDGASQPELRGVLAKRAVKRAAHTIWKAFKRSAVSSFVYVESVGLGFAAKLVGDATGWTQPVAHPRGEGLDAATARRLRPDPTAGVHDAARTGFTFSERVDLAEGTLRAMCLTEGFARLVLLTGHESTSVNNPHASSLDCGACGGQSGEANARVAAAILNEPEVRVRLTERGLTIPADTWFIAGVHDTTTDRVALYDRDRVPDSHDADLRRLDARLERAGASARRERAPALGVSPAAAERALPRRARDWAQTRPEWGLAGNAAFIAAPRRLTRHLDLGGRAFLHTYDWHRDAGEATLTQILTAPLVVASWINMQYLASTADPVQFGSGTKTLHNVVGALGVLEGNRGDLRVGLPWQSVTDGAGWTHEPLRLTALIAAPAAAIDRVLAAHASVGALANNGWLHLLALDPETGDLHRRDGPGDWRPAPAASGGTVQPLAGPGG